MKKVIFVLVLIIVLAVGALTFQGCTKTEIPGRAWVDKEIVTYNVYSGNSEDSKFATMVNTVEEISGEQFVTGIENGITLTNGVKFTSVISDFEGNIIMKSESLVQKGGSSNLWITLAGYKMVNYNGKNYTLTTQYDGSKNLTYTKTSNGTTKEGTEKVGSGYIDSDFIYTYMRTFDSLSSGVTKSITTFDKDTLESVTLSSSVKTTGSGTLITGSGNETETVTAVLQTFSRSSIPVGSSISVLYMKDKTYASTKGCEYESSKIPMTIMENGITFKFYSFEG